MFADPKETITCPKCGYRLIKPWPNFCPKCQNSLQAEINKAEQAENEVGSLERAASELKPTGLKASDKIKGVRVKRKSTPKIDLSEPVIHLLPNEYVKLVGIIHEERTTVYCSNPIYEFFLELACNLNDIASSVLGGELDQMYLVADDGVSSDMGLFAIYDRIIYILLGILSGKKANWLLNQLRTHVRDLLQGREITQLDKLELHNIQRKMDQVVVSLLAQFRKLDEVFSPREIPMVEERVRVDYFGLSYRSIGVISELFGEELEIPDLANVDDPQTQKELKQSVLTAKLEAIAANTLANTSCIPRWIAVKLGFERYRWMVFGRLPNDYFYQMLCEGNLKKLAPVEEEIKKMVAPETERPFTGDLSRFQPLVARLREYFSQRVFQ
ncbi:MAG: hypothetical protein Kow0069_26410 [Promethearchaeota archaeon]